MSQVFLGIGGNIGNKQANFNKVYNLIERKLGQISAKSSIYESPPWGFHAENNFWNQVLKIETEKSPETLLHEIHEIEALFGRKRKKKQYVSREMDIDILYYDDIYTETETLIIPHPRIPLRMFVVVPLAEIAPDFKHPLLRFTSLQMLENCKDKSVIKKVQLNG
jgi:2-amino-4-hydroxy-6-hydroxymethyldihydropteridine diphosphokinase